MSHQCVLGFSLNKNLFTSLEYLIYLIGFRLHILGRPVNGWFVSHFLGFLNYYTLYAFKFSVFDICHFLRLLGIKPRRVSLDMTPHLKLFIAPQAAGAASSRTHCSKMGSHMKPASLHIWTKGCREHCLLQRFILQVDHLLTNICSIVGIW